MSNKKIHSRIFRSPHDADNKYTKISNDLLRDNKISFKARGLICYLLSSKDDYGLCPKYIAKSQGIGEESVYSGLKELIKAGYCKRSCIRDSIGRVTMWTYEFSESKRFKSQSIDVFEPQPQNPDLDNPDLDNADYNYNCPKRRTEFKEQTTKELVRSFDEEKLQLLSPFNLTALNLKSALTYEIGDLRVSIAAFTQWVKKSGPPRDSQASLMTAIRQKWVPNEEKDKKEAEEKKSKEDLLILRKSEIQKLIKDSDLPRNYAIDLSDYNIWICTGKGRISLSYLDEAIINIVEDHLIQYDRRKI